MALSNFKVFTPYQLNTIKHSGGKPQATKIYKTLAFNINDINVTHLRVFIACVIFMNKLLRKFKGKG